MTKRTPRTLGGYQRRLRTLIRTLRKDAGWMRESLITIHNGGNEGIEGIGQAIRQIQEIAASPEKYDKERHYEAVYLLGLLSEAKLLEEDTQ